MRIEPSDDIGETVAGVEACDAGAKVAYRRHTTRDDLWTALAARQVVMTGIHRIDAITLTTPDMAASIAFYLAVGFTISFGGDNSEFTTMSIEPNGPHVNLISDHEAGRTLASWGRVIFHVDDVDNFHRRLVAAGFQPDTEPADASWGERYFAIHDPGGHDLSFATPLDK